MAGLRQCQSLIGRVIVGSSLRTVPCRGAKNKWAKRKIKETARIPTFPYSGDKDLSIPEFDETLTILHDTDFDEDSLSEFQKETLLLKNASRNQQMDFIKTAYQKKFGRDELDNDSLELQIATITLSIRNTIRHLNEKPQDKRKKTVCVGMINKRRALLNDLRNYDVDRFNWILEELNLIFVPYPREPLRKPTEEEQVRAEAYQQLIKEKENKLKLLQEDLQRQRDEYYSKKEELLVVMKAERDRLEQEQQELSDLRIKTGYPGNHGELAVKLADLKPVKKEIEWVTYPKKKQVKEETVSDRKLWSIFKSRR